MTENWVSLNYVHTHTNGSSADHSLSLLSKEKAEI